MKTHFLLCLSAVAILTAQNVPLPATGNVTLPIEEFNRLMERATQPAPVPDPPPVPHVIRTANANLKVAGELVSGNIVLEGEVYEKGARRVPLIAGIAVLDAKQKSGELPLELVNGAHTAVLPGAASFEVTLETMLPLTIEPGRASFQFPAPAAGAVRLALTVPGEQTLVNLSGGLIVNRSSRGGQTTIEATLPPGETVTFSWASRLTPASAPPAAPKEIRFLADVKTLVSVSDAEIALAALAEVSVVQGDPAQFELHAPEGYELTGASGPTLLSSDVQGKRLVLNVADPSARSHQFLITLAKSGTATKAEIPLLGFAGAQRETGEVLIEGVGAMELSAAERGGLRRMDFKETDPSLRALARSTLHAAFRYQKRPSEAPAVAPAVTLAWTRFPDGKVLSAVAQEAIVTTLVTSEGRSLTEVKLLLKNQAQPFMKVALPAGATILSAEVAGEKVKPVLAPDGNRVPLLRAGLRTSDAYTASFVFVHAGAPFAKKGGAELSLPKMDLPIERMEWEVFLPQQYKVADFGGDALEMRFLPVAGDDLGEEFPVRAGGPVSGTVRDETGAVIPRAIVMIRHIATNTSKSTAADMNGSWRIEGIPSGAIQIVASSPGFRASVADEVQDQSRGTQRDMTLSLGAIGQTVTVEARVMPVEPMNAQVSGAVRNKKREAAEPKDSDASANVADLQRRVAGVLPIAVKVPHAGNSYRFVRPLVVDEETTLTFRYRSK
jgi:hypothetical protein